MGEIILENSFSITKLPSDMVNNLNQAEIINEKSKTKIKKYKDEICRLKLKVKSQNDDIEEALIQLIVIIFFKCKTYSK